MHTELLRLAAYAGCFAAFFIFLAAGGRDALLRESAWIANQAMQAAAFLSTARTLPQIQANYQGVPPTSGRSSKTSHAASPPKAHILIVPGHEPDKGGTEFKGVYERDLVVDIADHLGTLLSQNPRFDVMVARTRTIWHPTLARYFTTNVQAITAFKEEKMARMQSFIAEGSVALLANQVYHNHASDEAALHLYGINKWSNEKKYDIVIHLHLNDYAGRRANRVGKYDGFSLYVPDHQYSNAEASKALGDAIAVRLNAYHATSTLPKEDGGVAEDQELIAIGSNNTANSAAVLIEYGYIYEPQFQHAETRPLAIADYAYQTYLGIQDFFRDPVLETHGSLAFPYNWETVTAKKGEEGAGVYALQATLHYLGFYPAPGDSFSDCPISGKAGPCTAAGIRAYQKAHGLEETGSLGPKTRAALRYPR